MDNIEAGVAEFRRLCVQNRITPIVEQDKQALKGYLTGELDIAPQMDINMAIATAINPPSSQQSASHDATTSSGKPSKSSSAHGHASAASSSLAPVGAGASMLLSAEEMERQRQKHIQLIEQTLHRSASRSINKHSYQHESYLKYVLIMTVRHQWITPVVRAAASVKRFILTNPMR